MLIFVGQPESTTIPLRTSSCVPDACILAPDFECLGPDRTICGGCEAVSSWMEMTVDECVRGEKVVGLPR
jgi:hypothetical protein